MQLETFFPHQWLLRMVLGAAHLLSQELCGEVEENQHRGWSLVKSIPVLNVSEPEEVQGNPSPSGIGLKEKSEFLIGVCAENKPPLLPLLAHGKAQGWLLTSTEFS